MATQANGVNGQGSSTIVGSTITNTGINADDLMFWADSYIQYPGVTTQDTALKVVQNGTPNKTVLINKGAGLIQNSAWTAVNNVNQKYIAFKKDSDSDISVTITDNSSGNPRIDLICAKFDPAISPDANASNVISYVAIAGTPAASPSVPSIPSDGKSYLTLAQVAVANGFSSITTSNITDKRTYANLNNKLQYGFRAKETNGQTISSGTYTTVIFNSEQFDLANNYDNTTGLFTAPVTGYYQFNTNIGFQSSSSKTAYISSRVNGSEYQRGSRKDAETGILGLTYSDLIKLNAGDTLGIGVFVTVSTNLEASNSAFSVILITIA